MDGGYINEGGQLKTKNGQKYIVNDTREGIFVSKSCAILTAIIAIFAIIIAILLTYFLTASSVNKSDGCSFNNNLNDSAGIFGYGSEYLKNSVSGLILQKDQDNAIFNKEIKLYEGWNPEIYRLTLEPNMKTSTTNGTMSVEINRDTNIDKLQPIVFDINNITIHNVNVKRIGENNIDDDNLKIDYNYGPHNDSFHITILSDLDNYLNDLRLIVDIDFTSQITDTMQGIYKSSYKDITTKNEVTMISTQFSPIDARRAFPCFDRPDKKANFSISIIHEESSTIALSNMPTLFTNYHRPGYIKEEFQITPKMSTYLVGFVISKLTSGNYSLLDSKLSPTIEIWSRPEILNMTKYAYTVARKVLPFFETYFGSQYKLPKLDLVSIPDFGYDGMENWGLITLRDSSLSVPEGIEQSSSANHKEYVANIIAHELAHQWFGNLVTPKWWNDLWLKEGFATYLSYLAVDHIEPDWKVLSKFVVSEFSAAMSSDSDINSHPIAFPVSTTYDIRRIFDSISYCKGATILKMINSFIGDEAFKMSIRNYLSEFLYKNAMHDDLWDKMTYYGYKFGVLPEHFNVKEIMDTWILQAGYPVVTAQRSGSDLIISQKRYILPESNSSDNTKWFIPITYVTSKTDLLSELPIYWIPKDTDKITISNVFSNTNNTQDYVYLNYNRNGYYRVNYDLNSWVALNTHFNKLPSITKAQLIEDSFYLARAEYLTYDIPLTFLISLRQLIDDHLLWAAASSGLDFLKYKLNREPAYESFRALMKFIVKPAYDHYGLIEPDNESHTMLAHRAIVVEHACRYNYDRCTNAAQLAYREWMRDPKRNPIKPNLKGTIYCTALREGSFQEWYFAYNRYNVTTVASEKEQIIDALGCTTKPWLLSKYLNMTIDENSGIRKQDGFRVFHAVAQNNIGYEIAYDFLVTNIKTIATYYGDGFSTLIKMVQSITTYMDKDYHLEQLNRFTKKVKLLGLKSVERTIELAREDIKNSIFWRSRSYYSLKKYLEDLVSEVQINIY